MSHVINLTYYLLILQHTDYIKLDMRIIILTLLCVHLLSAGYAQRHYFNHFGVDEGLSNNAILCSVQDKDGFIWFGTKDGLNRFDGYNFKQYYSDSQTDNGLGSNFIHTLFVDRDRKIWIGTDQGIFIFDPFTERFLSFQGETKGEVLMIKDDQAGNIWYISDNKLFKYSPVTRQKTQIDKHLGSSDTAFTIDQQNHVWMAYHQTIKNVTTGHTVSIPQGGREGYRVEKLAMDARGTLCIRTAQDAPTQAPTRLPACVYADRAVAPAGCAGPATSTVASGSSASAPGPGPRSLAVSSIFLRT